MQPLTLRPGSPRLLIAMLLAGHALAVAVIAVSDVPAVAKAPMAFVLLASAGRTAWRVARTGPRTLTIHADGSAVAELADGRRVDGMLASNRTVLLWLVLLRLNAARGRVILAVTSDMLGAEDFRSLRVALRLGSGATGSSAES